MVDDESERKRKRLGNLGFTLIELMIASGVVAMSMGVMFGSLISIGVLGQVAEGKTEATAYMMSVLEQARGMSRANLFTYTPQAPPQDPGFTMALALDALKADGTTLRLPLADQTAGSSLPAPFAVRATVVYTTSRGYMYSITSTTYVGTY
jgi:prepilin-type N-terminal cleavage/methylation domain-containing protein